jgi:hypothetical protein
MTTDRVPEGTYIIEFASGRDFSPVRGYFLSSMSSRRFVNAESFETQFQGNLRYTSVLKITLNPVVGGTPARLTPITPHSIATEAAHSTMSRWRQRAATQGAGCTTGGGWFFWASGHCPSVK